MTSHVLKGIPGVARLRQLGHRQLTVFPDLLGSLPAQIHSAGFQLEFGPNYNGNWRHPSKTGLATIRYTLSGRGRLRYRDQQLLIEPGQALLLYHPYDYHHWIQSGEQWEFFYITFAGREVIRCVREVTGIAGPVIALPADSPTVAGAAEACADALEERIASPYQGSATAHAILMELLGECCPSASLSACRFQDVPAFVTDVEEFCRQNFASPISVKEMADVAKMSRFHFTRLFQKVWGLSPGRYLCLLRLEKAMEMVHQSGYTVKEVAHRCGFGTANYFSKVFRKHYGVRPGSFKVDSFMFREPPQVPVVHDRGNPTWQVCRARGGPQ